MDLLDLYRKILLIRETENKIDYLFKRGLIHGTAHFCVGQEFIPIIVSSHLYKDDFVTSTHRGHGHALAKGLELRPFLAELMGLSEGYNSGKGGSQHIMSKENNYYSNGITGGMVPIGVGLAFANKYLGNGRVVVSYLGDGGFNEGYVLESLNLAKIFQLPILFVCENNFYAMSTPSSKTHSNVIFEKVRGFGIDSALVKNNDYLELNAISKMFLENIRSGGGPKFIEVQTYRHKGHSKNDLNLYRDKSEEEYWFNQDVLVKVRREILASGMVSEEDLEIIGKEIKSKVNNVSEDLIVENEKILC